MVTLKDFKGEIQELVQISLASLDNTLKTNQRIIAIVRPHYRDQISKL